MAGKHLKSLAIERKVHGIAVRKQPPGRYLQALEMINQMPLELIKAWRPEAKNLDDVLSEAAKINIDSFGEMLEVICKVAPSYLIDVLAVFTEKRVDELLNDPALGLVEILDIAREVCEVNGLGKLMQIVTDLLKSKGIGLLS